MVTSDPFRNPTGLIPRVRTAFVAGGAAGNHTLTGITLDDRIISVWYQSFTLAEGAPNTVTHAASDLTSEFSITADDTINNTDGTATSDGWLVVTWYDDDWHDESDAAWNV